MAKNPKKKKKGKRFVRFQAGKNPNPESIVAAIKKAAASQ